MAKKESKAAEPTYDELKQELKDAHRDAETLRAMANDANAALDALRSRTHEEVRPLYVIDELFVGGKRTGRIRRTNCGINDHELLGILSMAIDEVKKQITGEMPPAKRMVQKAMAHGSGNNR